jgi:hypothetical protein
MCWGSRRELIVVPKDDRPARRIKQRDGVNLRSAWRNVEFIETITHEGDQPGRRQWARPQGEPPVVAASAGHAWPA